MEGSTRNKKEINVEVHDFYNNLPFLIETKKNELADNLEKADNKQNYTEHTPNLTKRTRKKTQP